MKIRTPRLAAKLLFMTLVAAVQAAAQTSGSIADRVVMVCEHGSVKSLIAMQVFNRAAAQRGLRIRAVARGTNPDDSVPQTIAAALARDGFDVAEFRPERFSSVDSTGALRVVAIGVILPAAAPPLRLERWDDIPPASADYTAARRAIERHVDQLLDTLLASTHP